MNRKTIVLHDYAGRPLQAELSLSDQNFQLDRAVDRFARVFDAASGFPDAHRVA